MRPVTDDERVPWACDVCRKTGPWVDGWEWYGSWADYETCAHIIVTCSQACRASAKATRLTAAYGRNHSGRASARRCTA